ncbi:LysR family transcriptional regulator ArgP [Planosporangium mesophilum]|uniref:Transcriptional regulator ArgP n=1 Tax=Planosporangium mesophilum TaxID=689768 RepID=A0A8J3X0I2_9ACTN|nr:LysR family transcriptional regulator ArgP [Planosporangium mesophilum]NJC84521.1 LysR family transcriptional regulator ArgP [Planosporangium mesophilum]GII23332.1 transcriptional regulator ArgP [Planosporangium mesophilum]
MQFNLDQLRALSATVSEGTLEAAARALNLTPSAVSQRLRALEAAAGQVLLVRSKPVRVTPPGEAVLRLARQVDVLLADTARELGGTDGAADSRPPTLPVAVNADSLTTWVLPAVAPLADSLCLDLYREDQTRTSALLRDGTVVAAVTADAEPVPGCSSTRLGAMRYRPMAAPAVVERWFPDGATATALATAPVVVFDRADDLQYGYLRSRARRGARLEPPAHHVPSSADYLTAVLLGMGWGMLPDLQSERHVRAGELVELDPRGHVDVVLYWQQWKLRSPSLDRLTEAILAAARERLDQRPVPGPVLIGHRPIATP